MDVPLEILAIIFQFACSTPKQLADISLVCQQFLLCTKKYERELWGYITCKSVASMPLLKYFLWECPLYHTKKRNVELIRKHSSTNYYKSPFTSKQLYIETRKFIQRESKSRERERSRRQFLLEYGPKIMRIGYYLIAILFNLFLVLVTLYLMEYISTQFLNVVFWPIHLVFILILLITFEDIFITYYTKTDLKFTNQKLRTFCYQCGVVIVSISVWTYFILLSNKIYYTAIGVEYYSWTTLLFPILLISFLMIAVHVFLGIFTFMLNEGLFLPRSFEELLLFILPIDIFIVTLWFSLRMDGVLPEHNLLYVFIFPILQEFLMACIVIVGVVSRFSPSKYYYAGDMIPGTLLALTSLSLIWMHLSVCTSYWRYCTLPFTICVTLCTIWMIYDDITRNWLLKVGTYFWIQNCNKI